ncbi:unnamed protein product [Lactuca saligna]|uniref:Uncharacterized protein n=1 Tax=Lactuca saligna TaxID=75948 RepID=A0AA35ZYT7_LACSI|nr:unnamed protein product [Lactuca saligna]CAI9300143.1 unnamed protein product [Lactuca saligna]
MDDEYKENFKMAESERIAMKKCDKELDDLQALRKKLDVEEDDVKNAKLMLKNQKSLFPPWIMQHIQKEAIDEPVIYWLEPSNSSEFNLISPSHPRLFSFDILRRLRSH